jgi:hypothetical protein
VHDALGDPLVVEVEDLLAEVEVLERRRAPIADPQRVLVVGDRYALLGRQGRAAARRLVGLSTRADGRGVAVRRLPGHEFLLAVSSSQLPAVYPVLG